MTVDAAFQSSPVTPAGRPGARHPRGNTFQSEHGPLRTAPASPPTREQLEARVTEEAKRFEQLNQSLTFRLHEGAQQLMVQVVDRDTGKVLRETPPEEFLDLTARLREMVGFFLDEQR